MRCLAVLSLAVALAGCVTVNLHRAEQPTVIDGPSVQRMIDKRLVPILKTQHPTLSFAPSNCPATINVANGSVEHCVLPIGGTSIPVRVAAGTATEPFYVSFEGSVVDTQQLEQYNDNLLRADYEVKGTSVCPLPRVRLMKTGESVHCKVLGLGHESHFEVKMLTGGKPWYSRPTGVSNPAWSTNMLALHRAGRTTLLKGVTMARFIQSDVQSSSKLEGVRPLPGRVECPAMLDLSGKKHAMCYLKSPYGTVHYDVSIDDKSGWQEKPLDGGFDGSRVSRMAAEDLNERLSEAGLNAQVTVACPPGIHIFPVHSAFYCDMTVNGQWRRLMVEAGEGGTVRWRVAPESSPSPPPAR
jgi:hypothetical protein